jgi:dihydrolipoamide dehydrogenase
MDFDVIIVGSGPGGYTCAIRCAQLGMKTAIIEKYNTLGGTCLNVGCIPSKALLDSSELFYNAAHTFAEHGISVSAPKMDAAILFERKSKVVDQLNKGVAYLMKKNKIEVFYGIGSFKDANTISISPSNPESKDEKKEISAKNIIIATGSKPITPPAFNYDKKRVITSTEALSLNTIPKSMVIVGAGVIGLELGSVYGRLGTKIDVIEFTDKIIGTMDTDCGKELQRTLKKEGMTFYLNHGVTEVNPTSKGVTVKYKANNADEIKEIKADYCLVAIGRRPYTDGLNLEVTGIEKDSKSRIKVDHNLRTNVAHIYALGDVIEGAMLAHKAEEEGVFIAETIAGQRPALHPHLIPGVVYTWPEVASVGYLESELKEKGIEYKTGKFQFRSLGRAIASGDISGFVKVLADKNTDEVLGVHIIGARAADVIAECAVAMTYRASAEDIGRICHAHPTYAEGVKEAALDATEKRAINM